MPVLRWWSWGYGMRNECGHYACYFTSNGVVTGFRAKKFRCLAADFFVFAKAKASVLGVVPVSSPGQAARSPCLSRLAGFPAIQTVWITQMANSTLALLY